jgi:hypothetical protein
MALMGEILTISHVGKIITTTEINTVQRFIAMIWKKSICIGATET